jgi:hypothetical protein
MDLRLSNSVAIHGAAFERSFPASLVAHESRLYGIGGYSESAEPVPETGREFAQRDVFGALIGFSYLRTIESV